MVSLDGDVGSINERPRDQIEIAGGYEVLAGEAVFDMSDFEFVVDEQAELSVDMAVGQVTVIVPRNVYVDADASLEAGQIVFFDDRRAGQGVSIVDTDGDSASDARLSLDIDGALGQIEIMRSSGRAVVEGKTSDQERNPRRPGRRERERS
jgi:predicted membrane protein